jgi:proteasome lid subunit RPN8/RPN11
MSVLNKTLTKNILTHAEQEYPKECCGYIVKINGIKRYLPRDNISEDKTEEFKISGEQYSEAEDLGEVIAVVHSHPDHTTQPSIRDKAVCSAMGIPWVIVSWPEGDIRTIVPEDAPLIGRHFVHGTEDCYSLVRDYYKRELGIELGRYYHDYHWWENEENLYLDNFEKEGFFKVEDGSLHKHDLIFMVIRSKVVNHCAIYLGDGLILQHLYGKLSGKDVYGGYWAERTMFVARHKDLA